MQGKLTIQDIARLAKVSKATVSRVLNHNPSVDPTLSEHVMRIIEEYHFVPNATATGLARGRTRLIGVLAPPLTWPAVSEMLRGVAAYIEETSYEIVLYSISIERNHHDVLDRILAMKMISGLLAILPGALSPHLMSHFQRGFPVVLIDDQEETVAIPWVGIDNRAGAYEATRHLLRLGHKRIAHLRGPLSYYCAEERFQAYCQALQDAGISPDLSLILQGNFEVPSGRECATTLFSRNKQDWPSAIFAGNDEMAYGVLEVAEQQGIHVPEDVALVGFDDTILSAYTRPPLTTIQQPFYEMGRNAVELLLTMIDPHHLLESGEQKGDVQQKTKRSFQESKTEQPIRIQLPTKLMVRASSGLPISPSR